MAIRDLEGYLAEIKPHNAELWVNSTPVMLLSLRGFFLVAMTLRSIPARVFRQIAPSERIARVFAL